MDHEFVATITIDENVDAGYMSHTLVLPPDVCDAFRQGVVKKVVGELDGHRFKRTVFTQKDGTMRLMFGKTWLRNAGLKVDQELVVRVGEDPFPDQIDMPQALTDALALDPEIKDAWDALTPGKQRTHAYNVERAKREETKRKRAQKIVDELRASLT